MEDCNIKFTPEDKALMSKDLDGDTRCEDWDCAPTVGMLMCLAGVTSPEIECAVHECSLFSNSPKASHEIGAKRIVRCLKETRDHFFARSFFKKVPQRKSVEAAPLQQMMK